MSEYDLYHIDDKGRRVDLSDKQEELAEEAIERSADKMDEYVAMAEDELCQTEGNCRALINLNDDWDNLPSRASYFLYWNEENRQVFSGITMSSILFCKHGGIITAKTSGQRITKYNVKELMISKNPIALTWTTVEPATAAKSGTQKKIQNLCIADGIVYFDKDGFQRIKYTGLFSDPYLVAVAEYYQKEAMDAGLGENRYKRKGRIFTQEVGKGQIR